MSKKYLDKPGKGKTKTLKKWLRKHGYKVKAAKVAKMKPADMMGFLVPPHLPGDVPSSPFVEPRSMASVIDGILNKGPFKTPEDYMAARDKIDEGLSTQQLLRYAGVHSQRMEDEGFTKTALVLKWLAVKIEEQHEDIVRLNNKVIELNKAKG